MTTDWRHLTMSASWDDLHRLLQDCGSTVATLKKALEQSQQEQRRTLAWMAYRWALECEEWTNEEHPDPWCGPARFTTMPLGPIPEPAGGVELATLHDASGARVGRIGAMPGALVVSNPDESGWLTREQLRALTPRGVV